MHDSAGERPSDEHCLIVTSEYVGRVWPATDTRRPRPQGLGGKVEEGRAEVVLKRAGFKPLPIEFFIKIATRPFDGNFWKKFV